MSTQSELADEIAVLTGPSRSMDEKVLQFLGKSLNGSDWYALPCGTHIKFSQRFTAKVDLALKLVPPDWSWRVGNLPSGRAFASVGTQLSSQDVEAATPALALVRAVVLAKERADG